MKIKNAIIVTTLFSFISTSCDGSFLSSNNGGTEQPASNNTNENNNSNNQVPEDNKTSFTIRWVNYDEKLLTTSTVIKGQIPKYEGTTPVREETTRVTYTFTGWSPDIVAATKDATYKAVFKEVPKKYKATFYYDDNTVYKTIENIDIGTKLTEVEVGVPLHQTNPDLYELDYWVVKTEGADLGKRVQCANGKFECLDVDYNIEYVASFTTKRFDLKFYLGDEELFSFPSLKYNFNFANINDEDSDEGRYYTTILRHRYYEPINVNDKGEAYLFTGWGSSSNATTTYSFDSLPLVTSNANYYANFDSKKTNIMMHTWSLNRNGKKTEKVYTKSELVDNNYITTNGTTLTKLRVPTLDKNYGWGVNIYLNDSSITAISDYVDSTTSGLAGVGATNIYMPSIKTIGKKGLFNAQNLVSAQGSEVTSIGESGLSNNASMETINFPKVTTIGNAAFENNKSLKNIYLPKLTTISENAFMNCSSLEEINFDDNTSLTTIKTGAFKECTSLKKVHLPKTLSSVEISTNVTPFDRSRNIETLTVSSANTTYISEYNALIKKTGGELILATNGTSRVGSSVQRINKWAFRTLNKLETVTIPRSVKQIDSQAFYSNSNLKTIIYEGTEAQLKDICSEKSINNILGDQRVTIKCTDRSFSAPN